MANKTEMVDPWEQDFSFLRMYRYLSFYCPECEGEFSLWEAGQMQEHEDFGILSDPEDGTTVNVGCPECGLPHLEVILGVK